MVAVLAGFDLTDQQSEGDCTTGALGGGGASLVSGFTGLPGSAGTSVVSDTGLSTSVPGSGSAGSCPGK